MEGGGGGRIRRRRFIGCIKSGDDHNVEMQCFYDYVFGFVCTQIYILNLSLLIYTMFLLNVFLKISFHMKTTCTK